MVFQTDGALVIGGEDRVANQIGDDTRVRMSSFARRTVDKRRRREALCITGYPRMFGAVVGNLRDTNSIPPDPIEVRLHSGDNVGINSQITCAEHGWTIRTERVSGIYVRRGVVFLKQRAQVEFLRIQSRGRIHTKRNIVLCGTAGAEMALVALLQFSPPTQRP